MDDNLTLAFSLDREDEHDTKVELCSVVNLWFSTQTSGEIDSVVSKNCKGTGSESKTKPNHIKRNFINSIPECSGFVMELGNHISSLKSKSSKKICRIRTKECLERMHET